MPTTSGGNGSRPGAELPELGVGITFSSAIEPILAARGDLVDCVEFEPQTTWLPTGAIDATSVTDATGAPAAGDADAGRFRRLPEIADHLRRLPYPKLVHSIGLPVGGTAAHDPEQIRLLREELAEFDPPWVTDHLSFDRTAEHAAGFFLPPCQTDAGAQVAVESIRTLRAALDRPFAFETGVNYLAPRPSEQGDGEFVAGIAAAADCGILLDLHNVYTNAVNGRQPLDGYIAALDLERVWEVHLAGGFVKDGYWLDAHSGPMPLDLVDQARQVVASLPNLKAIVFEIYPAFVAEVGIDEISRQLELVRELWDVRGTAATPDASRPVVDAQAASPAPAAAADTTGPDHPPTPPEWERELGALVAGREPAGELGRSLEGDGGVALLQMLSLEFRASMISNNLRRTSRLLMLAVGEEVFRMFLAEYRRRVPPQVFAASEARAFGGFLRDLGVGVPQLMEVLDFELATLETMLDGRSRLVTFDFDPFPMLLALGEGRLPDEPGRAGRFEIEITPDQAGERDAAGAVAMH